MAVSPTIITNLKKMAITDIQSSPTHALLSAMKRREYVIFNVGEVEEEAHTINSSQHSYLSKPLNSFRLLLASQSHRSLLYSSFG